MSNSLWPHGQCPWNSPGQNTGDGRLSLLQGIFPTQGLNPALLHLQVDSLPAKQQGMILIVREMEHPLLSHTSLNQEANLGLTYSLVAQTESACNARDPGLIPGIGKIPWRRESSLTHSSILAWRIPLLEEPGEIWSMGSQRVGHNWVTNIGTGIG